MSDGPRSRPGHVRVIAGQWRGRRIEVGATAELRPSSDRVRETLFNWLNPELPGARCLDLFAGTGVLGVEAVSRGAALACLVERERELARRLRELQQTLASPSIEVVEADALTWLRNPPRPFNIVFCDPPFHQDFAARALDLLAEGWLMPGALVYIEVERDAVPEHHAFAPHRVGHTRQVSYALVRFTG